MGRPHESVFLASLEDALSEDGRIGAAAHDAEVGLSDEPLQNRTPHGVLKRRFRDERDLIENQEIEQGEEGLRCRCVTASPRLGATSGKAWAMPSLISSRQIAGQPTAFASR